MSMALKYGLMKKAKGGCVGPECQGCSSPQCMADGGEVGVHDDVSRPEAGGAARRGTSLAGEHVRGAAMAKEKGQHRAESSRMESARKIHREKLSELKSDKTDRKYLAEGGMVDDDDDDRDMELVDRIMKKRKGEPEADFEQNDFDVSDENPSEEFSYTGANSGDELGNEAMDENDQDLIRRIMRSRAKKDKMPRPA